MRRRAAEAVCSLVPRVLRTLYLGKGEQKHVEGVEGMLDVWGDAWMNRFVVFSLLEKAVVGVLPEVAGEGWEEGVSGSGSGSGSGEESMKVKVETVDVL
jgi:hypothetical protein